MKKWGFSHNLKFGIVDNGRFVYFEDIKNEFLPVLEIARHFILNPPINKKIAVQEIERLIKELKNE